MFLVLYVDDILLIGNDVPTLEIIKSWLGKSFTNQDDFKSQSGYVFLLNGGSVSWKWIRKFIAELGVVLTIADPITLYCDNSGAIAQAKERWSHQRNKQRDC